MRQPGVQSTTLPMYIITPYFVPASLNVLLSQESTVKTRAYVEISQSINQTSIVQISLTKPGSVARQPNQCSTAKLEEKQFHNINRLSGLPVSMGEKAKSRRCVLRCFFNLSINQSHYYSATIPSKAKLSGVTAKSVFLKGSNWIGWMDRQWEVVPKRWGTRVKSSRTCVALDPRDWQTIIVVWSQRRGWKWCGKHGVKT